MWTCYWNFISGSDINARPDAEANKTTTILNRADMDLTVQKEKIVKSTPSMNEKYYHFVFNGRIYKKKTKKEQKKEP